MKIIQNDKTNNHSKLCNQHLDHRCGNFFSELLVPRDSLVVKVVQVPQRPHHPRSTDDSRPTSANTQEGQGERSVPIMMLSRVTLEPFSFVGENTGFLPQKGQAEASLTRGPGSTLWLSCRNILSSLARGFLLSEPGSSRQAAQRIQTPTGLSALWSGATRRCRHCSSENNAAARFVPVISNLLRTVNKSQALSAYWRITKHSGVPPLTLLQRSVAFVIQAPTAELMAKEWH